jgi:hypothetical protein
MKERVFRHPSRERRPAQNLAGLSLGAKVPDGGRAIGIRREKRSQETASAAIISKTKLFHQIDIRSLAVDIAIVDTEDPNFSCAAAP